MLAPAHRSDAMVRTANDVVNFMGAPVSSLCSARCDFGPEAQVWTTKCQRACAYPSPARVTRSPYAACRDCCSPAESKAYGDGRGRHRRARRARRCPACQLNLVFVIGVRFHDLAPVGANVFALCLKLRPLLFWQTGSWTEEARSGQLLRRTANQWVGNVHNCDGLRMRAAGRSTGALRSCLESTQVGPYGIGGKRRRDGPLQPCHQIGMNDKFIPAPGIHG